VEESGFPGVEVEKMAKLPVLADPRGGQRRLVLSLSV
jgi:hypothetical protein